MNKYIFMVQFLKGTRQLRLNQKDHSAGGEQSNENWN